METVSSENSEISIQKFECAMCNYTCFKKQHLVQHFNTIRHKNNSGNSVAIVGNETECNTCKCGKIYKDRTGLWKHKKKCTVIVGTQDTKQDNNILMTLVSEIVKNNNEIQKQNIELQKQSIEMHKQNQDLQKQMLDICKNGIICNNQVNSNNKTFNLNLFLHEECKDAMNLSEFLESIKFQLADVEAVGELGYVNGISKLIIENLKGLDVTKRPIHCTDEKREIIYIKEAGVWTKDEDYSKLRRLIKTVSNRNFKHTRLYKEKYPDCIRSESKYSDTYNKIIIEATGGGSKCNDYESENKIMKKIAKAITIDKSEFLTKS